MVYVQTFIYNFATLTPFHMGNQSQHCKNKVVKLTNLFVSTVATLYNIVCCFTQFSWFVIYNVIVYKYYIINNVSPYSTDLCCNVTKVYYN